MRISLKDISNFSKCPRYYHFLKEKKSRLTYRRTEIFKYAIQRAYSYQMNGKKPTWRMIMGWIDSQIFKDIDVTSDDDIDKGRKLSESILVPLKNWYDKVFISEHVEGYVNVPAEYVVKGFQFHTVIPLLKLTEPTITAVIMDNVVVSRVQLYNDILARGTALIAAKQLGYKEVVLEHMLLGPSRALERTVLECDESLNRRTEKVLVQIGKQIVDKVNYPSITAMCIECPFKRDCLL